MEITADSSAVLDDRSVWTPRVEVTADSEDPPVHRSASPARNLALWLLALFSGALAFLGVWVILDRLPGMEAVLDDGTATTAQVYGGQSWVVVGAAVLAAGLVGLALTLAVAARSSFARPAGAAVPSEAETAALEEAQTDAETAAPLPDDAPLVAGAGDTTSTLR